MVFFTGSWLLLLLLLLLCADHRLLSSYNKVHQSVSGRGGLGGPFIPGDGCSSTIRAVG